MKNSKVIFVPEFSGNRTAFVAGDVPRDEHYRTLPDGSSSQQPFEVWEEDGKRVSMNPNCNTGYRIIEVPAWFNERSLRFVCREMVKRLGRPDGYPIARILRTDRMDLAREIIAGMTPTNSTYKSVRFGLHNSDHWGIDPLEIRKMAAAQIRENRKTISRYKRISKEVRERHNELEVLSIGGLLYGYYFHQVTNSRTLVRRYLESGKNDVSGKIIAKVIKI